MRLADLDPRWWGKGDRHGLGLIFQCPVHPGGACHQGVPFTNPLDGGPRYEYDRPRGDGKAWAYWNRAGDRFEVLSLSPSILIPDIDADGKTVGTHWHGWITGGAVLTA